MFSEILQQSAKKIKEKEAEPSIELSRLKL